MNQFAAFNKIKMEQPNNYQPEKIPEKVHYRKISMSGSAVAAYSSNNDKLRPKEYHFQFPKDSQKQAYSLNIKMIEEDYYRKFKVENGIKSLLKAYDQTRKRNQIEEISKLGLDVIKIKSFSSNVSNRESKMIHANISLKRVNHSKNSLKRLELKYVNNRQFLSPLKSSSRRGRKQEQQVNLLEIVPSLPIFDERIITPEEKQKEKLTIQQFQREKAVKRIFKRQKKTEEYLYKRLQGTENRGKQQTNHIYDKRLKSYLEFLWKNMLSHNIYINLDLKHEEISKSKKFKAYIAIGNNGAMVKGLLRRRFWWNLVDEKTNDCDFVWTQLKVNDVFAKQKRTAISTTRLKNQQEEQYFKQQKSNSKFRLSKLRFNRQQQQNFKILNKNDLQIYRKYKKRYEDSDKQRQYRYKVQNLNKSLRQIVSQQHHTVHNHLINNFYLGNKKALFYNMREYYGLMGLDVYQYLPLTFHIKKGMKDPEYAKFNDYYKRRAKIIEKESKIQQEGVSVKNKTRNIWIVKPGQNSNQGRGITVIDQIYELNSIIKQIQKPNKTDSNTNQSKVEETEHTYIVQMYIDRPMLYNNRKFDIRHYMLISNFYGVTRGYWYEQGYIRTSSYEFDINNFQPEIHLTNDAVQKRYPDYHKYEPFNKISYQQFQRYLDSTYSGKKYNFKEQILPQMKKMATDAVRSVYTKISPGNLMNNFEVFGLDFMIDKNFKPWLIQINTNPCLQCACPLLNRIIPYMIEQSFKLTLDTAYPPPSHYPNTCKHLAPFIPLESFKYELIFDSQISGEELQKLYRRVRSNLIQQIGQIEQDEEYKDDGKQCKLDDFT